MPWRLQLVPWPAMRQGPDEVARPPPPRLRRPFRPPAWYSRTGYRSEAAHAAAPTRRCFWKTALSDTHHGPPTWEACARPTPFTWSETAWSRVTSRVGYYT